MTKRHNEDFQNPAKCWTCDNDYTVDRDCNINVILKHKILANSQPKKL